MLAAILCAFVAVLVQESAAKDHGYEKMPIVRHYFETMKESDVKSGKFENVYDSDRSSCATLENPSNSSYGYVHLYLSEPVYVRYILMS